MKHDWSPNQSLNYLQKIINTMTTTLDTVVLFISQWGEVKRSTDLLAFVELTFGII